MSSGTMHGLQKQFACSDNGNGNLISNLCILNRGARQEERASNIEVCCNNDTLPIM